MTSHIWSIIRHRPSLWVQWIHLYKLDGKGFWSVQPSSTMSWGWRKWLSLRNSIRPFVKCEIGYGNTISAWHDNWSGIGPLSNIVTPRMIAQEGFNFNDKVNDMASLIHGWPLHWMESYPILNTIQFPTINTQIRDKMKWMDVNNHVVEYSSQNVWESIRSRHMQVDWTDIVWFQECVPRYAFHLWLVFRHKLKTQDRLKPWEAGGYYNLNLMCCPLCQHDRDSHQHLFFQCGFSIQIWNDIKVHAGMVNVAPKFEDIVAWIRPIARRRTVKSVVAKLTLATASYFIWQERNLRLFHDKKRTVHQLKEMIVHQIRLKLLTIKFKRHCYEDELLKTWKIPWRRKISTAT